MVCVFAYDKLHRLPHNRQRKHFTFCITGGFLTCAKRTPYTGHAVQIEFLFLVSNLFPKIIVIVDDGPELIYQSMALTPQFSVAKILRIGLFFLGREIAICSDQLSDSLFHHRPLHDKLCVFRFILG